MEFLGLNTKGVQEQMIVPLSDETTDIVATEAIYTFHLPYGFTIEEFYLSCNVAPTGSKIEVDISVAAISLLSTKITIDAGEQTSNTASVPYVLNQTKKNISAHKAIQIDLDAVGQTIKGRGLKLMIIGHRSTTLDL